MQLEWFDQWLKSKDTPLLSRPPVRVFVMGVNRWRDEQEWPLPRARNTPYYLHAGGELSLATPGAEAPDQYTYDPADPVPARGGAPRVDRRRFAMRFEKKDVGWRLAAVTELK